MTQDPLGDLSMKPTRDELVQRQGSRGKGGNATQKPSTGSGGSSQAGLWFVVVLILALGGGGGWYLWDQQQQILNRLQQSSESFQSAEKLMSGLQDNLKNRDSMLSKSGDEMSADIKLLQSEVRKLWDLSNKRNRQEIEQLTGDFKKLQTDSTANASKVASVQKQVASSAEALATLKDQLQEIKDQHNTLASAADKQRKELARLQTSMNSTGDLDDRVTSLEVSINAIDAYRQQINSRLQKLDAEVGRLVATSGSAGAP